MTDTSSDCKMVFTLKAAEIDRTDTISLNSLLQCKSPWFTITHENPANFPEQLTAFLPPTPIKQKKLNLYISKQVM